MRHHKCHMTAAVGWLVSNAEGAVITSITSSSSSTSKFKLLTTLPLPFHNTHDFVSPYHFSCRCKFFELELLELNLYTQQPYSGIVVAFLRLIPILPPKFFSALIVLVVQSISACEIRID